MCSKMKNNILWLKINPDIMSFPEKLHLDHNWFPPSDSETSQCFWLPRSTWCELLGNGARGRTPPPAGRLLRQHHQCPGCKERSPAAFTEGPQQNCAVSDGEGVDMIRAKKLFCICYNFWNFQQQSLTDKQKTHQKFSFFFSGGERPDFQWVKWHGSSHSQCSRKWHKSSKLCRMNVW